MSDKELSTLLKKSLFNTDNKCYIKRLQYMMDFGELSVQYEFCLN